MNLISISSQTFVPPACFMIPGLNYCLSFDKSLFYFLSFSCYMFFPALSFLFLSRPLQNCNIFVGQDFSFISQRLSSHLPVCVFFSYFIWFPSLLYHCSSFLDLLLCQRLTGRTTCLLYDSYVIQVRNNPSQWGGCWRESVREFSLPNTHKHTWADTKLSHLLKQQRDRTENPKHVSASKLASASATELDVSQTSKKAERKRNIQNL